MRLINQWKEEEFQHLDLMEATEDVLSDGSNNSDIFKTWR